MLGMRCLRWLSTSIAHVRVPNDDQPDRP